MRPIWLRRSENERGARRWQSERGARRSQNERGARRSQNERGARRSQNERGAALLEMAFTLPLLLFVCVGILEFGRAYQTWQVLTNAAREGARIAVLPGTTSTDVTTRVRAYMQNGQLPKYATATVTITPTTVSIGTGTEEASQVTVNYPFDFIVLDPIARLASGQGTGTGVNMVASATMRNES